jgi:hypothetical protein
MFHQEVGEKVLVRVGLQEVSWPVGWLLGFCLDWRVGAGVGVG